MKADTAKTDLAFRQAAERRLVTIRLGGRLGLDLSRPLAAIEVAGNWIAAGDGIVVAAADEADARAIVAALASLRTRHPLIVPEPELVTGYFASVASPKRRGMVHACIAGRPICGAGVKTEFQWTGSAVECNRCRRIMEAAGG